MADLVLERCGVVELLASAGFDVVEPVSECVIEVFEMVSEWGSEEVESDNGSEYEVFDLFLERVEVVELVVSDGGLAVESCEVAASCVVHVFE